jgi:leucyl aminopeptidase (aminopeptidase T)
MFHGERRTSTIRYQIPHTPSPRRGSAKSIIATRRLVFAGMFTAVAPERSETFVASASIGTILPGVSRRGKGRPGAFLRLPVHLRPSLEMAMKLFSPRLLAFCCAVAVNASCTQPAAPPTPAAAAPVAEAKPAAPPVDTKVLAAKLVKSAAIKEGDIVAISGGVKDWSLLEDVSVEVRKAGAFPLTTVGSDDLSRRMVTDVPEKYDSQKPALDMKITEMADVFIALDYIERDDLLAGVPPARLAARAIANAPVGELVFKRNLRQVNLGNGLLPTAAAAARFAIPQEQLTKMYWSSVNTDYDKLQSTATAVSAALAAGKTVHITNPNGTDLTATVSGRRAFQSDGVISPDDVKRGGAAVAVYLPAGESYISPVPGTAEGKIVADHYFFQGQDIQGLTLTFSNGRITNLTATSGIDRLKALYDAATAGKDEFSFIDIGLNPDVQVPSGSRLRTWVPAGMVTLGTGSNIWAGGANTATFGFTMFLPGSTVDVDGKTLVKDGALQTP